MSRTRSSAAVAFLMMLGGAALAFASQPGESATRNAGVYRGYLDTRSPRGPVQITLRVDAYASDDDLRAVEKLLGERGQEAMFAALGGMKPNGWLNFEHDLGYPVTVLGERQSAGGRRIVALLNRPLGFGEMFRGASSVDWPFSLVVLDIDSHGAGSGTFVPAAQAKLDKQGNIAFDDFVRIPFRVLRVREGGAPGA
jgi:hypothetical protein